MKFVLRINQFLDDVLTKCLIFSVVSLIALCVYSILSRWLEITNLWVDPLARHLVFLVVFLGAALAIEQDKHIRIDAAVLLLKKKLSEKSYQTLEILMTLVGCLIIFFLFMSAWNFWISEYNYPVDSFLGLKQYHLAAIAPVGVFLILIKYLLKLFIQVKA